MAKIFLISRELGSDVASGIANRTVAEATALAGRHDVTVITSDASAGAVRELAELEPRVDWLTVPEPRDDPREGFYNVFHNLSAQIFARICESAEQTGPPDYIEFSDRFGLGMVTLQARRTADPRFITTRVGVRLSMTREMSDALNRVVGDSVADKTLYDMERYTLAYADDVVCSSAGDVLGTYESFYGKQNLAPATSVGFCAQIDSAGDTTARQSQGPLRILYCGRFERCKGIIRLVEAVAGCELEDWELTLVGGDTQTGTLATSVRSALEQTVQFDPRIKLLERVPHNQVAQLIREHDAVILPASWTCDSVVGLEALAQNRPLLATPVGGHLSLVADGESGLLAAGTADSDLFDLLQNAIGEREALADLVRDGKPLRRFQELSDPGRYVDAIERLAGLPPQRLPSERDAQPTVSVVIPYYLLAAHVGETIDSVMAQTFPVTEALIVNNGSFQPEDEILDAIADRPGVRVLNTIQSGPSSARNFGFRQTQSDYVLLLDADDVLEPGFVERAVAAMESDPAIAYVCSWQRYIDLDSELMFDPDGYRALGNFADSLDNGVASSGGSTMLVRRSSIDAGTTFDETLFGSEDTHFQRELRHAKQFGQIVPEFLCRYRVRPDSGSRKTRMPNEARLAAHERSVALTRGVQWTKR